MRPTTFQNVFNDRSICKCGALSAFALMLTAAPFAYADPATMAKIEAVAGEGAAFGSTRVAQECFDEMLVRYENASDGTNGVPMIVKIASSRKFFSGCLPVTKDAKDWCRTNSAATGDFNPGRAGQSAMCKTASDAKSCGNLFEYTKKMCGELR